MDMSQMIRCDGYIAIDTSQSVRRNRYVAIDMSLLRSYWFFAPTEHWGLELAVNSVFEFGFAGFVHANPFVIGGGVFVAGF